MRGDGGGARRPRAGHRRQRAPRRRRARRGSSAPRPTPAPPRCSRSRRRTQTTCARTTRRSPRHADGLALLAYHFPAVSPPGIPVEVLPELPIAGLKDSSGDAGRLVAELGAYDGPLYVGSSAYLALAGPLGATGAILSLANTDPEGCIAALAGDMEAQRALLPGHRESRLDFPAGLKRRLARTAGTSAAVRAR